MREYDVQEMRRDELEEVNGGTSQVNSTANTNLIDSIKNVFNNIKEFFTR